VRWPLGPVVFPFLNGKTPALSRRDSRGAPAACRRKEQRRHGPSNFRSAFCSRFCPQVESNQIENLPGNFPFPTAVGVLALFRMPRAPLGSFAFDWVSRFSQKPNDPCFPFLGGFPPPSSQADQDFPPFDAWQENKPRVPPRLSLLCFFFGNSWALKGPPQIVEFSRYSPRPPPPLNLTRRGSDLSFSIVKTILKGAELMSEKPRKIGQGFCFLFRQNPLPDKAGIFSSNVTCFTRPPSRNVSVVIDVSYPLPLWFFWARGPNPPNGAPRASLGGKGLAMFSVGNSLRGRSFFFHEVYAKALNPRPPFFKKPTSIPIPAKPPPNGVRKRCADPTLIRGRGNGPKGKPNIAPAPRSR